MGLEEWIVDDTCLVYFVSHNFEKWGQTDDMCENSDHYRSRVDLPRRLITYFLL